MCRAAGEALASSPLELMWEGEGRRESVDDWKQLHNHSILLMLESRRIFSFNSLKWRAPLLALKCKQEAFNVHFSQKWNVSCSYWSKTLLLVFVLFGICKFCDGNSRRLSVSGFVILSCKQKCKRTFKGSLPEPSLVSSHTKGKMKIWGVYPSYLQCVPISCSPTLWVWLFRTNVSFAWCR